MDQTTLSTLKNLGLNDIEAGIYTALLERGGSQASALAKTLGIKRTTVYPILHKLAEQGFVTVYFRQNRRWYYAQKPDRVAALFGKKLDSFYAIIPMLQTLEKKELQSGGLRFIETLDELKQFYTGILDEYHNREYCVIGSTYSWEGHDNDFFVQYRQDRVRNKIRTRLLLTNESKTAEVPEESLLRICKYLPEKYQFKTTIDIFDDKVLVVSPELTSLALVISVPAMIDIFKSVFEVMWDVLP